jgi:uncharacterized protein (TIGR02246 family)
VLSQRICQAFSSLLLSLLAVSACNQSSRSDIPKQNASVEAELLAIQKLNQRAVDAVLAADVAATLSLWTDDFVMLGSEGPIIHGRDTIARTLEQTRQQGLSLEPLEYVAKFEEIKILGDYAYEWGTYRGKSRQPGGESLSRTVESCCVFFNAKPMGLGKSTVRFLPATPHRQSFSHSRVRLRHR